MLVAAVLIWVLLLVATLYSLRNCPRDASGRQHLISANGVFLSTFLIYLALPAINPVMLGGSFYWATAYYSPLLVFLVMACCLWAVMVYAAAYRMTSRSSTRSSVPEQTGASQFARHQRAVLVACILVGIGIAMKLLAVALGGGVGETVLRISRGVAATQDIAATSSAIGHLRNLSGISEAGTMFLLLESLRTGRLRITAAVLFVATVFLAMAATGKRLYILWPVLAAAAGLAIYVRPIRPRDILILVPAGLAFGFLTLMYRVYAPLYFAGALSEADLTAAPWAKGSLWLFYFNSLEFSFFELTAVVLADRDSLIELLGGPLLAFYRPHIEPFFYLIPRAIWPGKPESFLDVSHAMTSLVFGDQLGAGSYGIATSLTGTSYVFGGFLGLTLAFLLMGVICSRIDRRFITMQPQGSSHATTRIIWLSFWMMVVFHLLRQGTLGWVFMIAVVQQAGTIAGALLIASAPRFVWGKRVRAQP